MSDTRGWEPQPDGNVRIDLGESPGERPVKITCDCGQTYDGFLITGIVAKHLSIKPCPVCGTVRATIDKDAKVEKPKPLPPPLGLNDLFRADERIGFATVGQPVSFKLTADMIMKSLLGTKPPLRGIDVKFDRRDVWIGVFWNRRRCNDQAPWEAPTHWHYDAYICLIPCLPIHVWWVGRTFKRG